MTPKEAAEYLKELGEDNFTITMKNGLRISPTDKHLGPPRRAGRYWICEIPSNRITALGRGNTIEEAITEAKEMIDAIKPRGDR